MMRRLIHAIRRRFLGPVADIPKDQRINPDPDLVRMMEAVPARLDALLMRQRNIIEREIVGDEGVMP